MLSEKQVTTKVKTNFNDVTGDSIVNKSHNQTAYASGWERVFGNKEEAPFNTEFVENVLPAGIIGDEE